MPPVTSSPHNRRALYTALGIAVLIVVAAAVALKGSAQTATPTHTIIGTLHLSDTNSDHITGEPCSGSEGFSDIGYGTSVSVANAEGKLIATGQLGPGTAASIVSCVFQFTVPGVPDAAFYKVTISHRGELPYSLSQMVAADWKIDVSL